MKADLSSPFWYRINISICKYSNLKCEYCHQRDLRAMASTDTQRWGRRRKSQPAGGRPRAGFGSRWSLPGEISNSCHKPLGRWLVPVRELFGTGFHRKQLLRLDVFQCILELAGFSVALKNIFCIRKKAQWGEWRSVFSFLSTKYCYVLNINVEC